MSTENELKTPTEWCRLEGVEILDADGWRGPDSRDFTDPITRSEFRARLATCTQRDLWAAIQPAGVPGLPISDETIEQAAKAACEFVYPPKTHRAWIDVDDFEQDSWRATARVLLEAAYPAIRQQVAEQIAAAIEEAGNARSKHRNHDRASVSRLGDARYASYLDAAAIARKTGGAQ